VNHPYAAYASFEAGAQKFRQKPAGFLPIQAVQVHHVLHDPVSPSELPEDVASQSFPQVACLFSAFERLFPGEEARRLLSEFLGACLKRGVRCVRVVHGKGLRSPNREPVLKGKVQHWLARRNEVLAFSQAPQTQGGSGALLVLLKA